MSSSARRFATGAAILAATSVIGVLGYMAAGWEVLDAIYMVVITGFGVGYGEVRVMDPALPVFTIAVILVGCSSLIYILGGVFQMVTEGEINRALGVRRMLKNISDLRGHTIVCGFGRVGRVLADALREAGQDCVVVELATERHEDALARGFAAVHGDASDDDTLREAGVLHAKALATVLPADALNVFITVTAPI